MNMISRLFNKVFRNLWPEEEDFSRRPLPTPGSIVSLLPFRLHDSAQELYINSNSIGIMFEFDPLYGEVDDQKAMRLARLFSGSTKNDLTVQLYRFEHPHSGRWIERMRSLGNSADNKTINTIYNARYEYLKHSNEHSRFLNTAFYMRDVRCFIALSFSVKSKIDSFSVGRQLQQIGASFRETLSILSNQTVRSVSPQSFVNLLDSWLHPDFSLKRKKRRYSPLTPLNSQLATGSHSIEIFPNGILLEDTIATVATVQDFPERWSASLTPILNGDPANKYARSRCPTLTVTNFTILDYNASKLQASLKTIDLQKKSTEKIALLFDTSLPRQYEEWQYVNKQLSEGEKLVKMAQYIIAFSHKDKVRDEVSSILSLYQEKGWDLTIEKYGQFPAFLYSLPFMPSEGMYKDFCDMGRLRTQLTSTCASMCNFYGDFKGNSSKGILLYSRHGQPFFFNPFDSNSNFNISIVGVPGSGKSVFMQEIVTFILSCGGQVIVVDDGYSFKHSSILLGGEHIVVNSDISINPFSMVDEKMANKDPEYLEDALLLVEGLLECMVRPRRGVDESEAVRLSFAVRESWKEKGSRVTINDLSNKLLCYPCKIASIDATALELHKLLQPFCAGGSMSKYFEAKCNLDIHNAYTVYEMSVLDRNKTLQSLVLLMIMFMVSEKIYHGDRSIPKAIVIDEAWNLLSSKGSANFIEGIARRARKYKAALVTGTQDLNDYAIKGASNTIWNASNWRILFNQSSGSIEKAIIGDEKLLSLSPHSIEQVKGIATAKGQYSEMFITQSNDNWGVCGRFVLEPYSLAIYSSDASDVTAIEKIQRHEKVGLEEAIYIFVAQKNKQKL